MNNKKELNEVAYVVGKENARCFVFSIIVNPGVAYEVNGSVVRNVFKSERLEVELIRHEVLNVKCSRNSEVTVPFNVNIVCFFSRTQGWQRYLPP